MAKILKSNPSEIVILRDQLAQKSEEKEELESELFIARRELAFQLEENILNPSKVQHDPL